MKIELKHSSIIIHDYNLGDEPRLERNFTIYNPLLHTTYPMAIEYDEVNKRLYLPRGIDIFYLESIFNSRAEVNRNCDKYDYTEPLMLKVKPRDETQYELLSFLIGANQYANNSASSQLSCNAGTGKGKSYCAIASAVYMRLRTMIIASGVSVLKQWVDYIIEYTNIKESDIYFIDGSVSLARLFKKDITNYKFILCTHNTLLSYAKSFGWDKIGELFQHLRIGLKIFDEAHENFDNICRVDFHTNTFKTVYLTASPTKSNEDEARIYQLYFKNIPSISLFDPDNDPHTSYIGIKFKSHPTPYQIQQCSNQYGLNRSAYIDYVVNTENFYKVLIFVMNLALKVDGKCLFYIGTNNAIKIVYEWLVNNYPFLINDIGIYTSVTDPTIKESQLERKIILSTTKSCGAAMDIKGLKMTVVLAEPFKSEVLAIQTLGRTRARDTFYIEIVDMSFSQIKRFYVYKKPIFAKYALNCQEILLTDDQLTQRYSQPIRPMRDLIKFENV